VQIAQGLDLLSGALGDLHKEAMQRESLVASVGNLSRRLDEGLVKVGEMTAARAETERATDVVLSAMRHCIDELSAHCAWPPPGERDSVHGATLSEAMRHQQVQLHQLHELQVELQAQHDAQRQQMSSLAGIMQEQQHRIDESMASVTTAAVTPNPARFDTLAASVSDAKQQVTQLTAILQDKTETDKDLASQLAILTEKVAAQDMAQQTEKKQLAELVSIVQEQGRLLQEREAGSMATVLRELREARAISQASAAEAAETTSGLRQLKDEVTTIATALNLLCGRVNSLPAEDHTNALQTEMGVIASVVSKLSERLDQMSGHETSASVLGVRKTSSESTLETAQALRQRLGVLVGEVQQVQSERQQVQSLPMAGSEQNHQQLANPVRQNSYLGAVINYLECRADEHAQQTGPTVRASSPLKCAQLEDASDVRAVPILPLPSAEMTTMTTPRIVFTKAPSPRKWLEEPLSVSVGRTDRRDASSMAAAAADRMRFNI
jgi:hypothetical protein